MAETRLETVDGLLRELFAGSWQPGIGRHRLHWAFRGQPDADEPLTSPLARMGPDAWKVEGAMLRAFCKYGRRHDQWHQSLWDWLAVARHHGLPTRLLDWTYSPFVALHFATAVENDRDGVVWCLDFAAVRRALPLKLRRVLDAQEADVFSAEMLESAAPSLAALAKLSKRPFALFFEPPSLDGRIVNQFALFSLMSTGEAGLEAWVREHPETARRILLPPRLKREIRDMLDQSNVNERVLFPGLDGLSQYLRRYYTPPAAAGGAGLEPEREPDFGPWR